MVSLLLFEFALELISTVVLIPYYSLINSALFDYSELYIIPLMIAPFLRMISNNMIAQAYTANQNNEKSPLWKILLFGLTAIIMFVIIITVGFIGNHVIK